MNTFTKFSILAASMIVIGAAAGCSLATPSISAALPQVAAMTAEVGQGIARDLGSELSAAKFSPQPAQAIQTASVVVTDIADVVVVEASRLPASGHFADANTSVAYNVAL
jgi:phage portal protein BeeE